MNAEERAVSAGAIINKHILNDTQKMLTLIWTGKQQEVSTIAEAAQTSAFDQNDLALYRELIEHRLFEVMDSIYPACSHLLGKQWPNAVRMYLQQFPPAHYRLNRVAEYFSTFLQTHAGANWLRRFPFLSELADYEWTELKIEEDPCQIKRSAHENLSLAATITQFAPIVNPTLVIRKYDYCLPAIVESIKSAASSLPTTKKKKTTMAFFRNPVTHRCTFLTLGSAAAAIVAEAHSALKSYDDLMKIALQLHRGRDLENTIIETISLFEQLQKLALFIGDRRIVKKYTKAPCSNLRG